MKEHDEYQLTIHWRSCVQVPFGIITNTTTNAILLLLLLVTSLLFVLLSERWRRHLMRGCCEVELSNASVHASPFALLPTPLPPILLPLPIIISLFRLAISLFHFIQAAWLLVIQIAFILIVVVFFIILTTATTATIMVLANLDDCNVATSVLQVNAVLQALYGAVAFQLSALVCGAW